MEDTKLANKASERAKMIRKNKDFYDLHSSHFTSSKGGNVDRAIENRHAREKATATATEQKTSSASRETSNHMLQPSINFKRGTDSQVSYSTPALSSIVMDMSMTDEIQKDDELDSIKKHVKQSVFRIWKFYHKNLHSEYSHNEQTMWGLLMKCMRKKEPKSWWLEVRKTAVKVLTDQRNNCIKSMSTKYKSMDPNGGPCASLVSDYETKTLLEMRKNICFYAQILDKFAPCLVLAKNWNNDMKMNLYCCTTNQKLWQQHVLSVSDEVFLVLVLLNYSRRWFAEKSREIQKKSGTWKDIDDQNLPKPLYTYSGNKKNPDKNNGPGGGCGRHIDGKRKYNEIFNMVVKDRTKNSNHFNQELLKMFQQRRRNEAAKRGEGCDSAGMLRGKKKAFQCLDEFNAFDDDEEDEHAQSSYSDIIPQTCTSFEAV